MIRFLTALILLCSFTAYGKSSEPCWLSNPVTKNKTGFIGVANALSIKTNGSLIASRKRAFEKAITFYQLNITASDVKDFTQNSISLSTDTELYFYPPYSDDQLMYSYALVLKGDDINKATPNNIQTNQCEISFCNFEQCSPSWLCENNRNSIHSVSQQTANPRHQLNKTFENAQLLMQYLDKSYVDEKNYRVQSTGKHQNWQSNQRSSSVEVLGDTLPLLHTNSCRAENFLFTRYSFVSQKEAATKPFSVWSSEPNIKDKNGTVGIFKGIMADGRFSSAIKFAIKDGLTELAKIKGINITNELKVTLKGGLYSLSKTIESTSTSVSAKLMDLKIIHENGQLTIYAWLLEN